mmetsp:Transcript_33572/g.66806  ORF Transcript_33572/g.66806 Transcript_33572/m.66806 type:complete len:173 (+) Transcript_33572:15-533(+)
MTATTDSLQTAASYVVFRGQNTTSPSVLVYSDGIPTSASAAGSTRGRGLSGGLWPSPPIAYSLRNRSQHARASRRAFTAVCSGQPSRRLSVDSPTCMCVPPQHIRDASACSHALILISEAGAKIVIQRAESAHMYGGGGDEIGRRQMARRVLEPEGGGASAMLRERDLEYTA